MMGKKSFSSENFEDLRQASFILLEGWEEHEHKSLVSLKRSLAVIPWSDCILVLL